MFEPELHLGRHILVLDLAGWRREQMPADPEGPFVTLSPDWICEVVSPSTGGIDRVRKLPIHAAHEMGHAWFVDPESKTLEVFRLENGRWVLAQTFEGNDGIRAEPFDAIELPPGSICETWRESNASG